MKSSRHIVSTNGMQLDDYYTDVYSFHVIMQYANGSNQINVGNGGPL